MAVSVSAESVSYQKKDGCAYDNFLDFFFVEILFFAHNLFSNSKLPVNISH